MIFTLSTGLAGAEYSTDEYPTATKTEKTVNGFKFQLTEAVSPRKGMVRVFEAEPDQARSREETEALLLALGMEQIFIDRLTDETMNYYANSAQIVSTETYSKHNSEGNVTSITKEQAEAELKKIKKQQENQELYSTKSDPPYDSTKVDGYLRLHYLVAEIEGGDGDYLYSVSSRWLQMPSWRGGDSLAACAADIGVETSTCSGYYGYHREEKQGTLVREDVREDDVNQTYTSEDFFSAQTGNWYGKGISFELPTDGSRGGYSLTNTDFFAHCEFIAAVRNPQWDTNFNAVGTYTHTSKKVSLEPEFSISIPARGEPSISASVGVVIEDNDECSSIEFLIEYRA